MAESSLTSDLKAWWGSLTSSGKVVALILLLASAPVAYLIGRTSPLKLEKPGVLYEGRLEAAWLAPDGSFQVAEPRGPYLELFRIKVPTGERTPFHRLDLRALEFQIQKQASVRSPFLDPLPDPEGQEKGEGTGQVAGPPPRSVAVSADGSKAAAFERGRLLLRDPGLKLQDPAEWRSIPVASKLGAREVTLTFAGSDTIVAQDAGGEVEVFLLASGAEGPTVRILQPSDPVSPLSVLREGWSGKGRNVFAFKDSLVAAVGPLGDLRFAGGQRGQLLTLHPSKGVRALAIYDQDHVIVGGDFRGLQLLTAQDTQTQMVDCPEGTRFIAVDRSTLVYGGDYGLRFAKFEFPWGVDFGRGFGGLFGYLLVVMAAFNAFSKRARFLGLRKRTAAVPPPVVPPRPLDLPPDAPRFPPPVPPPDLVRACASGQAVLFAGAGLSAQAGLATARPLAQMLLEWASAGGFVDSRLADSLKLSLAQGEAKPVLDTIAGIFRGRMTEPNAAPSAPGRAEPLLEFFRRQYVEPRPDLPDSHRELAKISFAAVLTTNFDELLERAFVRRELPLYTRGDTEKLLNAFSKREAFLLKLFGRLDAPPSVVLSASEYADAVKGNTPFSEFVSTVFHARTLFFVGMGLDSIEAFLETVALRGSTPPHHYAIVGVQSRAWEARAISLKTRFGVEVVPYTPTTTAHPELPAFLEALARRVREADAGAPAEGKREDRLKQLVLENIGPFSRLELDLDPHCTVLVGDNGVGKSTILKAIAVGILGEASSPHGERLLKSGTSSGSITLVTGRDKYRTSIETREGRRVLSTPVRPFERERWLAIGFPALRGIGGRLGDEYTFAGRDRPIPGDLLPLVEGGTDPRVERIKAWILAVDHEASKRSRRYERLRDAFFGMVEGMAPGIKLKFKIDPIAKQVSVETDSGPVPLELVSQGTQSVIGWAGITLQRLSEISGESDPADAPALILMDELDAHMHPGWQHSLVKTLTRIFPNAQFLATTHSPFVVASLERSQVYVARRVTEGAVTKVEVKRPVGEVRGQRIDEILLTQFGLDGLRDPDTLELIERYTGLLADPASDPAELKKVAEQLRVNAPTSDQRSDAAKAFEILEDALEQKLNALPPEKQEKMAEEVKAQIQEAVARFRRPLK